MLKHNKFIIFIFTLVIHSSCEKRVSYLQGLSENDNCVKKNGERGICMKLEDCEKDYSIYKYKEKEDLSICSFAEKYNDHIICCTTYTEKKIVEVRNWLKKNKSKTSRASTMKSDKIDFETCRDEYLKYRNSSINPNHFAQAMNDELRETNKANCEILDKLNEAVSKGTENFWDHITHYCQLGSDGKYYMVSVGPWNAWSVAKGDRPNMAAIGWTQKNRKVVFRCGGSLVSDKFVVTAAHCKFFKRVQADTVRIGDRYLVTEEDDDIAQQVNIESFIAHPDYNPEFTYNDIAMIKTVEAVVFTKFVVPSCIDGLDSPKVGNFFWTVAGYGETEKGVQANVLLELNVKLVSTEECNKTYELDPRSPKGILDSQFCVKSLTKVDNEYTDTCFGDSGSPLQFYTAYETFDDNFEQTFLSTMYKTSTVLGIVSFGISCGLDAPSVYTKLEYFKDWMKSVIDNN